MIFLSILHEASEEAAAILERWNVRIPGSLAAHRRAAHALLYETLATGAGIAPARCRLVHQDDGRPVLVPDDILPVSAAPLPAISLSHSGGWLGCAVAFEGNIGLDLERPKAGRDYPTLAAAAYGPRETAAVKQGGEAAFYRLWSLREAWAKAHGSGLAAVADRRDRVPPAPEIGQARTTDADGCWMWLAARPLPQLYLGIVQGPVDPTANHSTIELRKCHVSPELNLEGSTTLAGYDTFDSSDSNANNTGSR